MLGPVRLITAIYVRVASSVQFSGASIETQKSACESFWLKHWPEEATGNAELPLRFYIDRDSSGSSKRRPALTALLLDAKSGLLDRLIIYDFTRLERHLSSCEDLLREFERSNCRVWSATESSKQVVRRVLQWANSGEFRE